MSEVERVIVIKTVVRITNTVNRKILEILYQ